MKQRILVVDDEGEMRSLLAHILKGEGYRVATAEDGVAALKVLKAEHFDILITDIRMPQMDGVTLYNNVKKLYPHLPVVFIIGCPLDRAVKGVKQGDFYYLEKPFNITLLKRTLRHVVEDGDYEPYLSTRVGGRGTLPNNTQVTGVTAPEIRSTLSCQSTGP